jgi:hypothetical protein
VIRDEREMVEKRREMVYNSKSSGATRIWESKIHSRPLPATFAPVEKQKLLPHRYFLGISYRITRKAREGRSSAIFIMKERRLSSRNPYRPSNHLSVPELPASRGDMSHKRSRHCIKLSHRCMRLSSQDIFPSCHRHPLHRPPAIRFPAPLQPTIDDSPLSILHARYSLLVRDPPLPNPWVTPRSKPPIKQGDLYGVPLVPFLFCGRFDVAVRSSAAVADPC